MPCQEDQCAACHKNSCRIFMKTTNNYSEMRGSPAELLLGFVKRLNDSIPDQTANVVFSQMPNAGGEFRSIRSIWETCSLSAGEFADQVAEYYRYTRITLPELMAAPALVG